MEQTESSWRTARWQTYGISFVITAMIFATALYLSNYFNDRRVAEIRATQDNISIDILSLETQFDLLAEHSCSDIRESTVLSRELHTLASRLSYLEGQNVFNESEVNRLKRFYSLLQIKDLLLMKEVSDKCGLEPVFILYFYSNRGDCETCEEQGYALSSLAEEYPQLRIYSFDYNLELSALQTLMTVYGVEGQLPALVINERVYNGFHSTGEIEEILPELATLEEIETATSTSE